MSRRGVTLLGLLGALLAACGGGGPTGTTVEVNVTDFANNPMNPVAAALQVGNGSWQPLVPTGTGRFKLTVPSGETRYGVALTCPFGLVSGAVSLVRVFQLTTTEATVIRTPCPSLSGNLSRIQGTVNTGLGAGSTYRIASGFSEGSSLSNGASFDINIPSGPNKELVVLGYNSGGVLQRARILRSLNASSNLSGQNVILTAADAVTIQSVNAFTPPTGFSGNYSVTFRSQENVYLRVGNGTAAGGNYSVLPGTVAEDLFFAQGSASLSGRQVTHIRSFSTPSAVTFNLPAEWPTGYAVNPAALPTFNNLTHLSSDAQFRAYQILINWGPFGFLATTISKGWLGTGTSYSLPDLTSIVGFAAKPFSGEEVRWLVLATTSNKPLGELLATGPAILGDEALLGLGFAALQNLEYKVSGISGDFVVP